MIMSTIVHIKSPVTIDRFSGAWVPKDHEHDVVPALYFGLPCSGKHKVFKTIISIEGFFLLKVLF
jgi:hypothetical protein